MQDRYAGDIGDYVKLALLKALAPGRRLGVAWYRYPNEGHNADGKHVAYLSDASRWRHLDPELFDALKNTVAAERSVRSIEGLGVLHATYHGTPMRSAEVTADLRCGWRTKWFSDTLSSLRGCNLVFADPDNGLIDDGPDRRRSRTFGKQMPLREAKALAEGRSAIIYHHNTRFPGGHDLEVAEWLRRLQPAIAVRANAYSCRTFFILNPDADLQERTAEFCRQWVHHRVSLSLADQREWKTSEV